MKKSDIIWGGDHKAFVRLGLPDDVRLNQGEDVSLEYDQDLQRYFIQYDTKNGQESIGIEPLDKNSENQLELIFKGCYVITTVLDYLEENKSYILKIQLFEQRIDLPELSQLAIAFTDEAVNNLSDSEKSDPVKALNEKFIYTDDKTGKDIIFIKGYNERSKSAFSMLSRNQMLHVSNQNNILSTENLVRYDSSKADRDAVSLIVGKIKFVDSTRKAEISELTAKEIKKISSPGTYLEIWNAYQNLETISLVQNAREAGVLKYNACSHKKKGESYEYRFVIDPEKSGYADFSDEESLDCCSENIINDNSLKPEDIRKKELKYVGTYQKSNVRECIVVSDHKIKDLPEKGYLFKSLTGDFVRFRRCEITRDKILNNQAEIYHLKNIIETGTVSGNIGSENAITKKVQSQFPKYTFNEEQKKAVYSAINTPDISLILGPPGTGKTTVIKAIIARFNEWFKKRNPDEIPKILISSFQHVAVDNAATGSQCEGLPPNRIGGKSYEGREYILNYISNWRREKNKKIGSLFPDEKHAAEQRDALHDEIYAWSEKGKNISEGIEILKNVLNSSIADISEEILKEAHALIAEVSHVKTEKSQIEIFEENEKNERQRILLSQRITKESFADDGIRQARMLKAKIEYSSLFEGIKDVSCIKRVIETEGTDDMAFKEYADFVKTLKEKYVEPVVPAEKSPKDLSHCIDLTLKNIAGEIREKHSSEIQNSEFKTAAILNRFLNMIADDNEVRRIINQYGNLDAVTCQAALDIRKNAVEKKYDLVLIDEAARANPLDLMIPMSMGKKVILVGDHKQLPHMLDPDVVREFEAKGNIDELGILKTSLFERLFEMLENSGNGQRTVRLSKQYRMHPVISDFASRSFYSDAKNKGLDSSEVNRDDKEAKLGLYNNKPLVFLDLPKTRFDAESREQSISREKEAEFVIREVKKLFDIDSSKSVGIITFYSNQRNLLKKYAQESLSESQQEKIEIGTVDAFQGKEFDVVFLSCVRANSLDNSNLRKKIGFVRDRNRLCVSFTRARQLLVTVGDSDTVRVIPSMNDLIELCRKGEEGYYDVPVLQ